MKLCFYAVKDNLVSFSHPFVARNDNDALRMFINSAKSETPNTVNTNPEDKSLYKICDYDDETGEVKPTLQLLAKAIDYVQPVKADDISPVEVPENDNK